MIPNNVFEIISKIHPALRNMQNLQNVKTPDDMAQQLLNVGAVNQKQVNFIKQLWGSQPNVRQNIHNQYKY